MLLDYQTEDEARINLIKAYIKAYENVNSDDFIEPIHQFTRFKDHKQYILALDSLAYMFKRMDKFNQAIEIYQKMAYYDDEDRFCAKACSLMCYVKLNRMDDFDRVLKELEEDSLYKIFLNLFFKLMKDEDHQEAYQKAYNKSPSLLDVLCQFKDISDDTIPPFEREFIEDFYGLFNEDPSIISNLKHTHENHKMMVS
jgi:tetratricopeptide (TPR) repeat protein